MLLPVELDEKVEGGWILDGQKRWIGNSTFADVLVIFARNTTTNQINGYVKHKYELRFFFCVEQLVDSYISNVRNKCFHLDVLQICLNPVLFTSCLSLFFLKNISLT